jgi:hypothetical protein
VLVAGASFGVPPAAGGGRHHCGGVTSFLLGLSPELGRSLRLDVLCSVVWYGIIFAKKAAELFETGLRLLAVQNMLDKW